MISVTREHEICAGHRVYGHEGKCRYLHGHNYKFVMTLTADELDVVGRVIDFSVVRTVLCQWLEDNWDHKMLLFNEDPLVEMFDKVNAFNIGVNPYSIISLPVNPTAERLAMYFCEDIAPGLLLGTGVRLVECTVWETSKCYATYKVKEDNATGSRNTPSPVGEEAPVS